MPYQQLGRKGWIDIGCVASGGCLLSPGHLAVRLILGLVLILCVGGGGAAWAWPPPTPTQLLMEVRETAGVARTSEVVRSGVPLPRSLMLTGTQGLAVVDGANKLVPAEFQVLARWNAGKNETGAAIQWLLVSFPATVVANGRAAYRLVTDGSAGRNPAPAMSVTLSQNGNRITVNTGVATFVLGGDSGALFDSVSLSSGVNLISGGETTATADSVTYGHPTIRGVKVEYAGRLSAVVVVDGAYAMPPSGGGGLGSRRRYVFSAGSPTTLIRQAVNWEGARCPGNGWNLSCDSGGSTIINALRVTRVRDALQLNLAAPLTLCALGARQGPAVTGMAAAGQEAWVSQQLRAERLAPLSFQVSLPGHALTQGEKADGGVLAAARSNGAVAVALNQMHRYEPQALRLLADGRLAVDLAGDRVWLGQRQGLFANLAVSALPGPPSRAELDRLVWAPLNRPLRAWPQRQWFAASEAVEEFPVGDLSPDLAGFDSLVPAVMADTLQKIEARGLSGLMTFGVYPRYWGEDIYGDELNCGADEPTPAETWDNAYWCGTWTDYHNTVAAVPQWAMRAGSVELLDELAFPGAWRTLHTQIMQCAPGDSYFFCGQSPAGYGGYRSDFNSSHAYFDNLFLYYWLTGDYTVVETLQRGASSMRNYLCSQRPGSPCQPQDPPTDPWAMLSGRVASQWFAVFRFVGLAGDDSSYLADWQSGLARAVTQHYVEANGDGVAYGFWMDGDSPVTGPGTYTTSQLWLATLLDMNNLYRLQVDTGDAPLGNPPLSPSRVLAAWARTLVRFGSTVSGDGTAAGRWPNALDFTWKGDRVGGALLNVTANTSGSDPYLYNTGKSTLTGLLLRAAEATGDPNLHRMGRDLALLSINSAQINLCPLGKIMGEYLSRLPAAVARLSQPPAVRAPALLLLLLD